MFKNKAISAATAVFLGLATLPASAQWTRNGTTAWTYLSNPGDWVGVGTTSPLVKFHFNGGQAMFVPAQTQPGVVTILPSGNGSWWNISNTHNGGKFHIMHGDARGANDNTAWVNSYFTILNSGNVGIGTINPQSKLAVNGTVTAKSLVVTTSGWADYVFKEDYKLRPLSAVDAFIKKEGHLPGIPKAEKVVQTGVDVGEMQVKLLEKIEELTLYAIHQQKMIERLAAQIPASRTVEGK